MSIGHNLRFFVYQIHFVCSFLRRPHTDRFPDDVLKKLRRNRNRDSCKKNTTGTENTGNRRIPAGICNLGWAVSSLMARFLHHLKSMIGSYKICIDQGFPRSGDACDILCWPYNKKGSKVSSPQYIRDYYLWIIIIHTLLHQASKWGMRGLQGTVKNICQVILSNAV